MTDQPRYRIVCADGTVSSSLPVEATVDLAPYDELRCGPHTVEPVEPPAPDPTCAQSSCIHCRNGKPGVCPVPPYPGRVVR